MKAKSIFILAGLLGGLFLSADKAFGEDKPALMVFHSPSCHRCAEVKKDVLPRIEKEFKGKLRIQYYDVTDIKNYALLFGLKDKYNKDFALELPVFFINGQLISGKGDVQSALEIAVNLSLENAPGDRQGLEADLIRHFRSFTPLAVIGAGLADGINPCAFTVIVFFISYLALQGYRKLELIAIGLSFILAVFCAYLLMGLGIFNFLYRLEAFWAIARVFNTALGLLSLTLGGLAIYDLLKFRKTHNPEEMLLRLPRAIKNQIHSVIGLHFRAGKEAKAGKPPGFRLARLILSALISGFLVSILEAVCTGQLYLPTISFILKATPLKLQAFGYLLAYNIVFIAPLLIIFFLALFGVTSTMFSQFIRKHMAGIKALMSVMFIGLGVFLIWRG